MEAPLIEVLNSKLGTQSTDITAKFVKVQQQLQEQTARLDQMQVKVDLSLDSIGKIQQEQMNALVAPRSNILKGTPPPPLVVPSNGQGPGVKGPGGSHLGFVVAGASSSGTGQGAPTSATAPGHGHPPQPPPAQQQLRLPAPGLRPQVQFPHLHLLFMRGLIVLGVILIRVGGNIGCRKWIFQNLTVLMPGFG